MSVKMPDMNDRFEPRDPARRLKSIVIVVVLHALLGYALVSGLAREGLNLIKKPLAAVVIQEVTLPPPPPRKVERRREAPKLDASPPPFMPPPDVAPLVTSTAPVIQSAAAPPPAPAPVLMAPAPPAAVATGPKRTGIGLACPRQVPPEMPRRALQEGTQGVVKAQIHIKGGNIVEVTILSGPRVFHAAVKAAIMQYTCITDEGEVIATQEFNFKLE